MNKLKELLDRGWTIDIKSTKQGYKATAKNSQDTYHPEAVGTELERVINEIYNSCRLHCGGTG